MSQYNRKGYRSIPGRNAETGELQSFPVKVGSGVDRKHRKNVATVKGQSAKNFRDYKRRMKEIKKNVPPEERANINWSRVPEKYL